MADSLVGPDVRIAALEKKRVEHVDPMAAGRGTPWEDRGSSGVVGAFFKTCWMSLVSPIKLLRDIRRPETTSDATAFAVGCGILWGFSWLLHGFLYAEYARRHYEALVDTQLYYLGSAVQVVLTPVAIWLGLKFATLMYYKLVAAGMKIKARPELTYNIFAYCLGPSILALVPVVGPILAPVWIVGLMIVAGITRQRVGASQAIVCALLTALSLGAIGAAGYFVLDYAWRSTTEGGLVYEEPKPKEVPARPSRHANR